MDPWILAILGTSGMFLLIALHVPIGIAMGVAGVVSVGLMLGWEPAISLVKIETSGSLTSRDLAVIPLFLIMGGFAGVAGLSSDLYRLAYALVGHYRGGLAMSTIGACAGFGAVCGSSVATAATMARVALPEMTRREYATGLATGSIAAGGTLGMLIPPSIIMVLYAVLTEQFVITLFVAAIVPGLLAVVFHFIAIGTYVRLVPGSGPPGPRMDWAERGRVLLESWGVVVLGVAVSGGIYGGVFTVSEAAAVGAIISLAFAWGRGKLTRATLWKVLRESASNTGLIYLIIIGAHVFSNFVALTGMAEGLVAFIKETGLHPLLVMLMIHIMYLILGSVFDTIGGMVITLPFVYPLILELGFDPIWFGVIIVMVIEIGLITPPIGINVFVLHGIAKNVPMSTIFKGIVPFLTVDLIRLAILTLVPGLALWLPRAMNMPM